MITFGQNFKNSTQIICEPGRLHVQKSKNCYSDFNLNNKQINEGHIVSWKLWCSRSQNICKLCEARVHSSLGDWRAWIESDKKKQTYRLFLV